MIEVFREPSKRATLICDSSFSELSQYKFLESQSKARPRQFTMSVREEHSAGPQPSRPNKIRATARTDGVLPCAKVCNRIFKDIFFSASFSLGPTCGDDGLQLGAIDEGPLDGLRLDIGPVDPLLQGVVVHHGHVVDVGNRQRRHHVHVRVVDVHAADLRAPHVQQEAFQSWPGREGRCSDANYIVDLNVVFVNV